MKIAICDDLEQERITLRNALSAFFQREGMQVQLCEFTSGEALLQNYTPDSFSLVFLDVYMGGITGVETARRLREIDPNCLMVFITTSLEHGADAFDVDAFHYLVKPLDPQKLEAVMLRWKNILAEIQTVTLKCSRSTRQIPVREILYIEVSGRVSTVHTVNEVIPTSMTLSSLEELLPAEQFVKPIRYLLAALRYIQNIGDTHLTLTDGTALNLARAERENLRQALSTYRLRQLRRR